MFRLIKGMIKGFLVLVVILAIAGYAVWHFGTKYASEKIVETVEANLNDENLADVKSYIANDPTVQQLMNEAANINPEMLPFQTKEEATRVIIKKVGVNDILDIKEQAENGNLSKEDVIAELEGKLSEDEITALKYVLYQELN